jgi:tRNA A37 threonylcarbamoyladenosine modification protein TsaB
MILYINTILPDKIKVSLLIGDKSIDKISHTKKNQAEKLLLLIEKLLKENKVSWHKIKKILVADSGGSFTSLRVGVLTANALAYGYNISVEAESKEPAIDFSQFKIIKPIYNAQPNIGISKKKKLY